MARYIALLRAVNVGGAGMLPMTALKALCVEAGFGRVETYIASGNVVFDCAAPAPRVKEELQARLLAFDGKPLGVILRTGPEMQAVFAANPFAEKSPAQVVAIFLDEPPPADALNCATGRADEETRLGSCEIYVHYPAGLGRSKLKIPAAKQGTARNMNTIAKLAEMARD